MLCTQVQRGIVQHKAKETENELRELIRGNPQIVRQLSAVST